MPEPAERPPIASAPISVLLLPPDDATQLDKGLSSWVTFLNGLDRPYEILLLGDGDNLTAATARHPSVTGLSAGPGVGAALRTGLAAAKHELLFYSTADKRYRPADLKLLLEEIDKADLVCGYRASHPVPLGWRSVGMVLRFLARWLFGLPLEPLPGWLGWRNHAFSWLVRLLFGVRIHDVGSEFKLFRRSIFARIPIQSDGTIVHTEILAKANFLGCLMAEVPISYRAAVSSAVPDRQGLTELRRLLKRPDFGPSLLPPS